MKILKLESYEPGYKDDLGRSAVVSRAWVVLWSAASSAPAGSVESTAKGVRVFGKLKNMSERSGSEGESRRLRPEGADLYLSIEELEWLKQALTKFRDNVPVAQADALVYLDELISKAPEISEEELAKGKENT